MADSPGSSSIRSSLSSRDEVIERAAWLEQSRLRTKTVTIWIQLNYASPNIRRRPEKRWICLRKAWRLRRDLDMYYRCEIGETWNSSR
ncbi:MAG: hypothetical protein ACREP6_02260, partial [Candidatus Binataceae bacterium]